MIIALTITSLISIAIAATLAYNLHREATAKAHWKTTAQQQKEQIDALKVIVENHTAAAESQERISYLRTLQQQSASAHQELRDIILTHLTPSQRKEFLRLTAQDQP